jgi:hypothetical protein
MKRTIAPEDSKHQDISNYQVGDFCSTNVAAPFYSACKICIFSKLIMLHASFYSIGKNGKNPLFAS